MQTAARHIIKDDVGCLNLTRNEMARYFCSTQVGMAEGGKNPLCGDELQRGNSVNWRFLGLYLENLTV